MTHEVQPKGEFMPNRKDNLKLMASKKSPEEEALIHKAIDRINESLRWPDRVIQSGDHVIFNMGTGSVDESGGGSFHDIDTIEFPAESLHDLIFLTLGSNDKTAEILTNGIQNTDREDWPCGRVDGTSIHRNNEAVTLKLKLTMKDGKNNFSVNPCEEEKTNTVDQPEKYL